MVSHGLRDLVDPSPVDLLGVPAAVPGGHDFRVKARKALGEASLPSGIAVRPLAVEGLPFVDEHDEDVGEPFSPRSFTPTCDVAGRVEKGLDLDGRHRACSTPRR
jgi:hypothetical protein